MILKLATIITSFIIVIAFAASASAQQKRQTPARTTPPPAPTPAPTPPPTFDTLLPADSYRIYGEVRSVGQLVRSNSVNEILEPILKLAGPPKEFRTVVNWLNTHADEVISSRLLFAAWASTKEIPDALVAIEFASPEEADRFKQQLNGFLQKVMPPTSASTGEENKPGPPTPQYHMQQAGSLILITPTPLNLKKLRPAGSKLLSEDVNFRVARNRLNTESIFVFVDSAGIEKEDEERRKQYEESRKEAVAANRPNDEATEKTKVELQRQIEQSEAARIPEEARLPEEQTIVGVGNNPPDETKVLQARGPSHADLVMGMLFGSFGGAEAKWPQAIAGAISLEGESIDARVLLVNAPGEKSDPFPFLPVLAPGPAITAEAPSILPADTGMLVTMSLDLQQIFTTLRKPEELALVQRTANGKEREYEGPYAALEKRLNIKIKDDLLPLIGSEIAVSLPMTGIGWFQPPQPPKIEPPTSATPGASPSPQPSPEISPTVEENSDSFTLTETTVDPTKDRSIAIAISLKDKEGMRALMPKLIESLAFKGAAAFAQTERRDDTELVSYANVVAYAFIGNFLVLSPDVATTRHIVDSYLKRETLSGEPHFKNYTRWQPRQVHGQVYISPSLMESYRTWIQQPTAPIDEQTRAFLTRFSVVPQPVTYSLSNEGFGPLHELHVPKNLVLFLIAAISGTNSPAPASTPPSMPPDNPRR